MDARELLDIKKTTVTALKMRMKEARSRDFFSAHEAASLWIELWDECVLANKYSQSCLVLGDARLHAMIFDNEEFTKYATIRSAIKSKIFIHSGKSSASCSKSEFEKDHRTLKQKGCMIMINPAESLISKDLLIEIATSLNERPVFLFHDKNEAESKPLDPRKETSLHCLVAALAKALHYSPDDKNTVGKIDNLLTMEGITMDKKTIRTNIKEAFETLNEKRE